jgi:hypothetical protein
MINKSMKSFKRNKEHHIEQTNHSALETASNNNNMFSLIPSDIMEKLTSNSTNTLVYVMYLQWAYMVTLMVILNLSKEVVGDCGCIVLPLVAGCLPAVMLYGVVREWRKKSEMKGVDVEEKDENKMELIGEKKENKKKQVEEKEDIEQEVVKKENNKEVVEKKENELEVMEKKNDNKKEEPKEKKEIKNEVVEKKKENKNEDVEEKREIKKEVAEKKKENKKEDGEEKKETKKEMVDDLDDIFL